jgi:hypothetical protein
MAIMSSQTEADTDASKSEYLTYAPSGETCPDCNKAIGTLDRVRRGMTPRPDSSPGVVYRHAERCPR